FQKTFISPREFVDSWDREIYELRNLDYFIYLMINYLGNQLEKRYFIRDRQESRLSLSFESIATLCFNIGDSFEYFLEGEEGRTGEEPPEFFDLDSRESRERQNQQLEQRIRNLKSFLAEGILQEQNFRVDLMEHVVLDSLLQFYLEEMNLEFGEEDIEIVELADFIEDTMVSFIRNEGQELLQRPSDPAIDHFEDLLGLDEDYREDKKWQGEEEGALEEESWEGGGHDFESFPQVVERFTAEVERSDSKPSPTARRDIELFATYLSDYADVHNLYDLSEEHLQEFMSVWLLRHFAQQSLPEFSDIFQTMARFLGWLNQQYQIDHGKNFADFYDRIKIEVPRIARVMNAYLENYNLFEVMMLRDQPGSNQLTGFFEVKDLNIPADRQLDLHNIHFGDNIPGVMLNTSIFPRIKPGDVLHATLFQKTRGWEVLEIHFLYPGAAKPYLN
nr:hypothetical protein [Calditrichia bacterium]